MLITCRSIFSILCGNKQAADLILLTHLLVCYNTDHLQHPQRVKNTQTEIPKGIKNTATTRSVPGVSKTISLYSLIALQLDDQDMIYFFYCYPSFYHLYKVQDSDKTDADMDSRVGAAR